MLSVEEIQAYMASQALPFVKSGVEVRRVVGGTTQAVIDVVVAGYRTQLPNVDVQMEDNGHNSFTLVFVQR